MEKLERTAMTARGLESLDTAKNTAESAVLNELSEQVRVQSEIILDQSKDALMFFLSILSSLAVLFKENPQKLRLLMPVLLMLFSQGCMYAPKYEDYYDESIQDVEYQEQHTRKNRIVRLTANADVNGEDIAAVTTEINPCQRQRIIENMETMIKDISKEDFEEYLSLCEKAKRVCGIMNPDRYSPRLLEEVVKNYESREHNAGLKQVLILTSRKDVEKTFDIQALSVQSHEVEELTKYYKVILIETGSESELQTHLNILHRDGILERAQLRSVLVISHGNPSTTENGITEKNIGMLRRLNQLWVPGQESSFVFFSCRSAEGGHDRINLANRASIMFPNTKVFGCTTVVESVNYDLDEQGRLVKGSLEMSTFFSIGSDTFRPDRKKAVKKTAQALQEELRTNKKTQCQRKFEFFHEAVQLGIIDTESLTNICTENLDMKSYSILQAAGWMKSELKNYDKKVDIPLEIACAYASEGVRGRSGMMKLYENEISPAEFSFLREAARSSRLNRNIIHPAALAMFKKNSVKPQDLVRFIYQREMDPLKIIKQVHSDRLLAQAKRNQQYSVVSSD